MYVLVFRRFLFRRAKGMEHSTEETSLDRRRRLRRCVREGKERDHYPKDPFHVRVFQQTLQNVSNPLSIAHDSRVGDRIIPDSGGTVRISQIETLHGASARAGK